MQNCSIHHRKVEGICKDFNCQRHMSRMVCVQCMEKMDSCIIDLEDFEYKLRLYLMPLFPSEKYQQQLQNGIAEINKILETIILEITKNLNKCLSINKVVEFAYAYYRGENPLITSTILEYMGVRFTEELLQTQLQEFTHLIDSLRDFHVSTKLQDQFDCMVRDFAQLKMQEEKYSLLQQIPVTCHYIAINPNRQLIAIADQQQVLIFKQQATTWTQIQSFKFNGAITLHFNFDLQHLACQSANEIHIYNLQSKHPIRIHQFDNILRSRFIDSSTKLFVECQNTVHIVSKCITTMNIIDLKNADFDNKSIITLSKQLILWEDKQVIRQQLSEALCCAFEKKIIYLGQLQHIQLLDLNFNIISIITVAHNSILVNNQIVLALHNHNCITVIENSKITQRILIPHKAVAISEDSQLILIALNDSISIYQSY